MLGAPGLAFAWPVLISQERQAPLKSPGWEWILARTRITPGLLLTRQRTNPKLQWWRSLRTLVLEICIPHQPFGESTTLTIAKPDTKNLPEQSKSLRNKQRRQLRWPVMRSKPI